MLELIRLVLTHFVLFRVGLPRNLLTPLGNREVQGPSHERIRRFWKFD